MAIIDQELENAGEKQAANIKIDKIINRGSEYFQQHPEGDLSNSPKK